MHDIALSPSDVPCWESSLPEHSDLDQVFSRYMDAVYRFLYSRVGNREDAEDLTSEVFLKAARQLNPDRAEASIAQWLFTVARTVLADHWRRYYRAGVSVPLEDYHVDTVPAGNDPREDTQRSQERVAELLARLPERYRRVLELRFLQGYSVQEAAKELGITPDNVKVIQHRALARAVAFDEGRV
ncbi:MAG: sigma-70 family RNA polymerase sigma factor [Chloroflexota bacterium]